MATAAPEKTSWVCWHVVCCEKHMQAPITDWQLHGSFATLVLSSWKYEAKCMILTAINTPMQYTPAPLLLVQGACYIVIVDV